MKIRATIFAIILAAFFYSYFAAAPVLAQTPVPPQAVPQPSDDQVNAVARELYCPVCENTPLDVCPTKSCANWRDLIRAKLALGWDKERIKQYFADQYGDRVLPVPPARGLNWLMFVIPPLILLGGALVLFNALRRKQTAQVPAAPLTAEPDEEYMARVEDELKNKS
jgi:cytochrome c-type biogenesis protein CcmH